MAKKNSSSRRWIQRQNRDPYVLRAQAEGWRSRAAFKLMEIDERDRLLRRGAMVLDLGAAPGGWSQVAAKKVGDAGRVIAVDLLEMEPLEGVFFIQGDISDEIVLKKLAEEMGKARADIVLSDMAPNISGNWSVDQPRSIELAEMVLEASQGLLRQGGSLVFKVFQGEGFEALVKQVRDNFESVRIRKPAASRSESREMYLVAGNYRL